MVSLWITLSVGFPSDPGYLLIAFGEYTFETSLFALLVLILFIYLCVRLLLLILGWVNPIRLVAAGKECPGAGEPEATRLRLALFRSR